MRFLREDPSIEILANHFETLLLRIESGQSLRQALQDAPEIRCDSKWSDRWIPLRQRLLEGQSQALGGLRSFRNSLLLEQKLGRLIRKKAFMPLFQGLSVILSSLLLIFFTQVFGDEVFRFGWKDYLIEAFLFGGGSYWIYRLICHLFADLWYLHWIDFVGSLEGQIAWGQNLLGAWKNARSHQEKTPLPLRSWLENSYDAARNYTPLSVEQLNTQSFRPLEKRCCDRWAQIHQLFVRNEPIRSLLTNEVESSYQKLEYQLELKSEKMAAYLMLPLFICFLPASLYVVLAPLVKMFV